MNFEIETTSHVSELYDDVTFWTSTENVLLI